MRTFRGQALPAQFREDGPQQAAAAAVPGSGSQDVAIKARFAMAERHICGILLVRLPAAGASALIHGVSPGASGGWTCTPAHSLPDRPAGLMVTTQ